MSSKLSSIKAMQVLVFSLRFKSWWLFRIFTKNMFVIFTQNVFYFYDNKDALVHFRHLSPMAAVTKLVLVTKDLVKGQQGAYAEKYLVQSKDKCKAG